MKGRFLILGFSLCLYGCDSLSTGNLSSRCNSLYWDVLNNTEDATAAINAGEDAGSIAKTYAGHLDNLTEEIAVLRDDVAKGGEKHQWEWPRQMRSRPIEKFELEFIGLREAVFGDRKTREKWDETLPFESEAVSQLHDLKWFCNRVTSANMRPLKLNGGLYERLRNSYTEGKSLEIIKAIKTEEERDAYTKYRVKYYGYF